MFVLLVCLLPVAFSIEDLDDTDVLLSNAQRQFSTDLFQTIAAQDYSKDVVFSPFSAYSSLLTMYIASAGHTEETLEKILCLDPSDLPEKLNIMKKFFDDVPKNDTLEYEFTSFDRVYVDPEVQVKKEMGMHFGKKLSIFKTKNKRDEEINQYVSKHTNGMIKKLFEDNSLLKEIQLLFVNAAYFKGSWEIPFTGETSTKPFFLSDGSVTQTSIMSVNEENFNFITDPELQAYVISLPYKGDDVSMIIILPTTKPAKNSPPPIAEVVKKLTNTKFQKILSDLQSENKCSADLYVPKFVSEEKYDLRPVFEALGGEDFLTQDLDLTYLLEPGQDMFVGVVAQKTRVSVYENGTEAAAASAISTELGAYPKCPTVFNADHPFAYIIYDRKTRYTYFMGILNKPQ